MYCSERDDYKKSLQGYQFCCFWNIIIGIYEDDIHSYNASGRSFLEERKVKLEKKKQSAQNDDKIAGKWGNQGVCWAKSVN